MLQDAGGEADFVQAGSLRGRRILMAEDEIVLMLHIEDALKAAGATVLGPATTLLRALSIANDNPYIDAAILDVDLRGEKVYPLAQLLREREVPILFYSGRADPDIIAEEFPEAVFCHKPTPMDTLLSRLGELVS
jgi:DNA-binding response OmpR family regulator